MPESKRPLKVFLCHASADKPAVRDLYKRLVADGVDAWLDAESLVAGQNWQVEIPKAIRESDVVIVCLSEKSINKEGYVQREIKFALDIADEKPEGTIFIIPARLDECKAPDRLSMYHWVELFEKDGYERLMRALRLRADKIDATLQIKKKWSPIVQTRPAIFKKFLTFEQRSVDNALPSKQKLKPRKIIGVMVQGLLAVMVVTGLVLTFWNPIIPKPSFLGSTQVDTTPSFAAQPSETHSVIQTKIDTVVPTSLSTEITDAKGVSMVLVPAGEFTMGPDNNKPTTNPAHNVNLDAFWIDSTEVTNEMYALCNQSGECPMPYYAGQIYAKNPVTYVSWNEANLYCEWAGRRLPTEAEWEKAARGLNGFTYSWGNNADCSNANARFLENSDCRFNNFVENVGNYPLGVSPFGALDMIGNVWEWVADWYDENYYTDPESAENPLGPINGNYRVLRGGSFYSGPATTWFRSRELPSAKENFIGFRCAKDANP